MFRKLLSLVANLKKSAPIKRHQGKTKLILETLEQRELMAVTPLADQIGIVRNGHDWHLDSAGNGGLAEEIRGFGLPGDQFLVGDWNGDGNDDLIAVRGNIQGGLSWLIDLNADNQVDIEHAFGLTGDKPVLGDWNGDGTDDPGVVRQNAGSGLLNWYLDSTHKVYANPTAREFGLVATKDAPIVGDWDADGKTDLGVTRVNTSSGKLTWLLDTNGDKWADQTFDYGDRSARTVVGDWNGSGRDQVGIVDFDATKGLLTWSLDSDGDHIADQRLDFGFLNDNLVVGNWSSAGNGPGTAGPQEPGTQPPVVADPEYPQLVLDGFANGTTFDFGKASVVGPVLHMKTFTIRNAGDAILEYKIGEMPTGFVLWETPKLSLQPNESTTFKIAFGSSKAGSYSGQIRITSNDRKNSEFILGVKGIAESSASKTDPPTIVIAGVNPGSTVTFGSARVGASVQRVFTVTNTGDSDLVINRMGLKMDSSFGGAGSGFSILSNLPRTIGAHQSATFVIKMQANGSVGLHDDLVQIVTNDPNNSTISFRIEGTVVGVPAASVSFDGRAVIPNSVLKSNLGVTFTNLNRSYEIQIQNTGSAPLALTRIYIPQGFIKEAASTLIQPGAVGSIRFRVDTGSLGIKSGSISFYANTGLTYQINLTTKVLNAPERNPLSSAIQVPSGTLTVYSAYRIVIEPANGAVSRDAAYVIKFYQGPGDHYVSRLDYAQNLTKIVVPRYTIVENWTNVLVLPN